MTWRAALLLAPTLLLAACRGAIPSLPQAPEPFVPPEPDQVEAVVFLVGDAGDARTGESPVLQRLQEDIEYWAAVLPRDSAVAVAVLGDVVYPVGLHPADHPSYDADTAVVMAQVRLVLGPAAQARRAHMYFMAGNHDWGTRKHREGFIRLRNLDDFLRASRVTHGAAVELVPPAGTGGPHVVDLGEHLRMILLDTAWWLLSGSDAERRAVLDGVDEAIAGRGSREVLLAAHHPFRSVGPHGGHFPFWETAGVRYILARSGAILQDITSVPYRGLEYGLREIFGRHGVPLVFAGGHEHSLQVLEGVEPTDPRYTLVSGSASKLTVVGNDVGVRYAASEPGYIRLVVERSGGISAFVVAAPREYLKCPPDDGGRCMAEGAAAFRTKFALRLR
jgi:hypothetical protein